MEEKDLNNLVDGIYDCINFVVEHNIKTLEMIENGESVSLYDLLLLEHSHLLLFSLKKFLRLKEKKDGIN